jgi:hypothetical protein
LFRTVGSMQTHLTMASSCKWYMKGKFREWEEEAEMAEEPSLEIEELVLSSDEASGVEDYNPEEDDNLYHEEGDLGRSDLFFIPREAEAMEGETLALGEQGPGPETAAQRIQRHSYRILDDDCDDRVTEPHPLAGRISKKVPPPSLRSVFQRDSQDGAEDNMDVDQEEDNAFYPFNSELDWRVAQWAIKDNPGQNSFDRLLAVPGVGCVYVTLLMLIPALSGC